jgi:hypothetical protein
MVLFLALNFAINNVKGLSELNFSDCNLNFIKLLERVAAQRTGKYKWLPFSVIWPLVTFRGIFFFFEVFIISRGRFYMAGLRRPRPASHD